MVMFIHGEITSKTANEFINMLPAEPVEVHIDSIGGDLFAGLKIYNSLTNHEEGVEIIVDGLAGSVASVIALAGAKLPTISSTGSFMIHNALVPQAQGNHNDLRKIANTLEKYSSIVAGVYADKTKLSINDALNLMNQETTFTPEEAVELGFASGIEEPLKAVAKINKIDMNLLEIVKSKIKNEAPVEGATPEPVAPVEGAAPGTAAPVETTLTDEMKAEIAGMIQEMIAEALAGNTEEVGATIATVLNSIVSEGVPPTSAEPQAVEPEQKVDGVTAFRNKMNEIKNKKS